MRYGCDVDDASDDVTVDSRDLWLSEFVGRNCDTDQIFGLGEPSPTSPTSVFLLVEDILANDSPCDRMSVTEGVTEELSEGDTLLSLLFEGTGESASLGVALSVWVRLSLRDRSDGLGDVVTSSTSIWASALSTSRTPENIQKHRQISYGKQYGI